MDEEVGALVVAVVGNKEAGRNGGRTLRLVGFENLSSLRYEIRFAGKGGKFNAFLTVHHLYIAIASRGKMTRRTWHTLW